MKDPSLRRPAGAVLQWTERLVFYGRVAFLGLLGLLLVRGGTTSLSGTALLVLAGVALAQALRLHISYVVQVGQDAILLRCGMQTVHVSSAEVVSVRESGGWPPLLGSPSRLTLVISRGAIIRRYRVVAPTPQQVLSIERMAASGSSDASGSDAFPE